MKKIAIATILATSALAASAADFVSVSVDQVTNRSTDAVSTVQYVRAGKEISGVQYGLQSRTAAARDGSSLKNSLEGYVGKNLGVAGLNVQPFVGIGYDNGKNGATDAQYTYGLVGVSVGAPIGGGYALAGVKTRVASSEDNLTNQTVSFAQYAYPVAKQVNLIAGASYSAQDIKERAYSLGVQVGF